MINSIQNSANCKVAFKEKGTKILGQATRTVIREAAKIAPGAAIGAVTTPEVGIAVALGSKVGFDLLGVMTYYVKNLFSKKTEISSLNIFHLGNKIIAKTFGFLLRDVH